MLVYSLQSSEEATQIIIDFYVWSHVGAPYCLYCFTYAVLQIGPLHTEFTQHVWATSVHSENRVSTAVSRRICMILGCSFVRALGHFILLCLRQA